MVEDLEPIQQDQSLTIQKEEETFAWVRQNLIKLGKMFIVDMRSLWSYLCK